MTTSKNDKVIYIEQFERLRKYYQGIPVWELHKKIEEKFKEESKQTDFSRLLKKYIHNLQALQTWEKLSTKQNPPSSGY